MQIQRYPARLILAFASFILPGSLVAQTPTPSPIPEPSPESSQSLPNPPDQEGPAQRPHHRDGLDELALSPEQKVQIQQLNEGDHEKFMASLDQVKNAHEGLELAIRDNPSDEATIKAKAADLTKAIEALTLNKALHEAKFLQILTTDQRQKWRDLQESEDRDRRPHFHSRHKFHGQPPQGFPEQPEEGGPEDPGQSPI